MSEFVHLHLHSQYSLLQGASTVEALIERTKSFGMDSLAITDARLKGREGRKPEARNELAENLVEAEKMGLVGLRLEIKLAQAEVEAPSDPGLAKQRMHEVEDEARAKGYLLLASDAQRSRNKLGT